MMKCVSIIIPVYNTPMSLIDRSVESALGQDGVREILLIDDGSEHECAEYLDVVQMRHCRTISVMHLAHGGVSKARNAGLAASTGEYVAFLDADDELSPDFIETALVLIADQNADAIFGAMTYRFANGSSMVAGNDDLGKKTLLLAGKAIEAMMGSIFNEEAMRRIGLKPAMYVSNCAALYKKKTIEGIEFKEGLVISEDRLFNYDVLSLCQRVVITGRSWYTYIQNSDSSSQSLRVNAREELIATAEAFEALLKDCPKSIHDDIIIGIIECFMQTINFTVLKKDFREHFYISRLRYVRDLFDAEVYKRAFSSFQPHRLKHKLLKHLFIKRRAASTVALFAVNHVLFRLRHR